MASAAPSGSHCGPTRHQAARAREQGAAAARDYSERTFTPKQREVLGEVLTGRQRHTLLYGGSRSGKTYLLLWSVIRRALRAPGSRHACFRYRFNACKSSLWLDTFPKVMGRSFPGFEFEDDRSNGFTRVWPVSGNASEIWWGGLDEKERTEKVLGQEFATIYLNECSQIPYSSVRILQTRLAQVVGTPRHLDARLPPGAVLPQRAYYDCNPPDTGHWTHSLWMRHADPVARAPLADPHEYVAAQMNPRDNPRLSADYIRSLETMPERDRRRFYEGEFQDAVDGALWPLELLEQARWPAEVPLPCPVVRLVVAVDPSGAKGVEDKRSDEIGIVVAGLLADGRYVVVEDATCRDSADAWAGKAIDLLDKHKGDRIVAEVNYGGDLVRATVQLVGKSRRPPVEVPFSPVTATRGKIRRAEPIAALFEQNKVLLWGRFPELEDQLGGFTQAGYNGERSPDRADSMIWALSYLARGPLPAEAGVPSGIAREAPPRYLPSSVPSVLPVPGDIGMLG